MGSYSQVGRSDGAAIDILDAAQPKVHASHQSIGSNHQHFFSITHVSLSIYGPYSDNVARGSPRVYRRHVLP